MKFLAMVALFFTFSFAANAQRAGKSIDPAQSAEKQTAHMVEQLSLDEIQAVKVKEINLTYAKKMKEAREDNKGNRNAMKEIMTAINTEKTAEIKQVLTDEQFQSFEEMVAKKRKGKRGKRGRGSRS